jgi:hypothetical protein
MLGVGGRQITALRQRERDCRSGHGRRRQGVGLPLGVLGELPNEIRAALAGQGVQMGLGCTVQGARRQQIPKVGTRNVRATAARIMRPLGRLGAWRKGRQGHAGLPVGGGKAAPVLFFVLLKQ